MEVLPTEESRAEGQAFRAVVVPGDEDYTGPHVEDQPAEHIVEESHRLGRRDGPVIDVAGDDDCVWLRAAGQVHELVQEVGLVVGEVHPKEDPAQMPVRRVNEAHGCRPQTKPGFTVPLTV